MRPRSHQRSTHSLTPSRRDLRDSWRAVARIRRDAGDIEGARRAARIARELDAPVHSAISRLEAISLAYWNRRRAL